MFRVRVGVRVISTTAITETDSKLLKHYAGEYKWYGGVYNLPRRFNRGWFRKTHRYIRGRESVAFSSPAPFINTDYIQPSRSKRRKRDQTTTHCFPEPPHIPPRSQDKSSDRFLDMRPVRLSTTSRAFVGCTDSSNSAFCSVGPSCRYSYHRTCSYHRWHRGFLARTRSPVPVSTKKICTARKALPPMAYDFPDNGCSEDQLVPRSRSAAVSDTHCDGDCQLLRSQSLPKALYRPALYEQRVDMAVAVLQPRRRIEVSCLSKDTVPFGLGHCFNLSRVHSEVRFLDFLYELATVCKGCHSQIVILDSL